MDGEQRCNFTDVLEVGSVVENVGNDLAELISEVNEYEGDDIIKPQPIYKACREQEGLNTQEPPPCTSVSLC